MSEPPEEYGWRFLKDGEVIRECDEFWEAGDGPWRKTRNIGDIFYDSVYHQIRRRIETAAKKG